MRHGFDICNEFPCNEFPCNEFPMAPRSATIQRRTSETQIRVELNLDGQGRGRSATQIGFFDHMLDQVTRHGLLDLVVEAQGDLHIDPHHTVEDTGIVLGTAVAEALGDRGGIRRYGHAYVPLDEALSRVVIDFSGRPGLYFRAEFSRPYLGTFDTELVREFFQGFANHARATLHMDNLFGHNAHHVAETLFKAFGRALRSAAERDPRADHRPPSTKGVL